MKLSSLAAPVVMGALAFAAGPTPTALAQGTVKTEPGKIDLRPKWKAGQETRLKMDMDSTGKQATPAAGESQVMQTTLGTTLRLKCKESNPETGTTLEVGFESTKLSIKSPLGNVDFDSTKPDPDNPADEAIKSFFDAALTCKVDPSGNITSIDGDTGGMALLGGADMIKSMLKTILGPVNSSQKDSGRHSIGESWTNNETLGGAGATLRITTTNTLKSLMGSLATVALKGAVTLDPSSSGLGIAIKDSSMTGEYKWDVEAGMLESSQVKSHLAIEQGKDAPTRTTQDMNMKVTRVHGGPSGTPGDKPATNEPSKPGSTPKDWGPVRK
jgi:hypothetical protein